MILSKSIIINNLNDLVLENIDIELQESDDYSKPFINGDYKNQLNKIKDEVCNYKNWDTYRKIFTSLLFLNFYDNKQNIGVYKKKVLSRSYFKMIEIQNDYNILQGYEKKNIKVCFIAEAPGGFIEAFYKLRNNKDDSYFGISLLEDNDNIPCWYNLKKKLKQDNLHLLSGYDKTGDIYKLINMLNMINEIGENSCEIVTADGGFDFTKDYINQEYNFMRLFLCEIILALKLQKKNGTFIIKCFDITNIFNLKLFYLLCHLYEKVIITKLKTSRQTNSERYIICKRMKFKLNDNTIKKIYKIILNWNNIIEKKYINDIFNFNINKSFLNKIELYNSWFFEKQLDIYNYISDLNNNLNNKLIINIIKQYIENNIENSIYFCKLNKLYINYDSYFITTPINIIIEKYFKLLN